MLGDFLRFCVHHGLGGFALLAVAVWAASVVVLAAILGALVCAIDGGRWAGDRFGERFGRTMASLVPSAEPMARVDGPAHRGERGAHSPRSRH